MCPEIMEKPKTATIQSVLTAARARLAAISDTPGLDAQVLLADILGKERPWLLAHGESALTPAQAATYESGLAKLEAGQPLPYILGRWEFYGREFTVSPDVLIPRPETELLIERALAWLAENPTRRRALDVGTGSGCIAVTLAAETTDLNSTAVDISEAALEITAENAHRHGVSARVMTLQGDLMDELNGRFDLICANLPYIPRARLAELKVSQHEPRLALDGGPDGLALIEKLLAKAPSHLKLGGLILMEIDDSHVESAPALALRYFPKARIEVKNDLAGKPRLLEIEAQRV